MHGEDAEGGQANSAALLKAGCRNKLRLVAEAVRCVQMFILVLDLKPLYDNEHSHEYTLPVRSRTTRARILFGATALTAHAVEYIPALQETCTNEALPYQQRCPC